MLKCNAASHITKRGKWWDGKGKVVCVCVHVHTDEQGRFVLTRTEIISIGLKLASFIVLVHDYIKGT